MSVISRTEDGLLTNTLICLDYLLFQSLRPLFFDQSADLIPLSGPCLSERKQQERIGLRHIELLEEKTQSTFHDDLIAKA